DHRENQPGPTAGSTARETAAAALVGDFAQLRELRGLLRPPQRFPDYRARRAAPRLSVPVGSRGVGGGSVVPGSFRAASRFRLQSSRQYSGLLSDAFNSLATSPA